MSDRLEDLVPSSSATGDVALALARAMTSLVPGASTISEPIMMLLERGQAERLERFHKMLVEQFVSYQERVGVIEDAVAFVASDAFVAEVTRAQRIAAETASETKRRRLAAAAVSAACQVGPASERARFRRLVSELDDLHVWQIAFYADPKAWLERRGLVEAVGDLGRQSSLRETLSLVFGPGDGWIESVDFAAFELQTERLCAPPQLVVAMTAAETLEAHIMPLGVRFLEFLNEGDPAAAEAPRPV